MAVTVTGYIAAKIKIGRLKTGWGAAYTMAMLGMLTATVMKSEYVKCMQRRPKVYE